MKEEETNIPSAEGTEESTLLHEQGLPDAETAESTPEAKLEVELSESRDKYLRLYSDFENYKKRVARDRIELVRIAGADMLLAVLPILDDMERAVKAMNETDDLAAIREGFKLIYNKLISITEAKGLKPMESIGQLFNVDLHDAITNVAAPSENMKGKVIDEIEKGYYLNDKVIRHAKVIVGG